MGRSIRIGDVEVTVLVDGVLPMPREHLIHGRGEAALADALARMGERPLQVDVNCFLLRGPEGVELVDAGTGPFWGPHLGFARAALRDCGVAPEAVDRVFLTHLHSDHAYGLLGDGSAYYPNADVVLPEAELAFYGDPAERARLPAEWHEAFDIADALVAIYGPRLHPAAFGHLRPGLDLLHLPGHTRNHGGYLLRAGEATLLLLGDVLHFEGEQAEDPDLGLVYDIDPAAAADTRRAVLGRAADEGWIVGGGHIRGFGRVTREGGAFRIAPV